MHSFFLVTQAVLRSLIQIILFGAILCSYFYLEYTKKKYAVQQKTGKRRMGEAKGSVVEVSSTFLVLFHEPQKVGMDKV
jgi:hypothetical protein